MPVVVNVPPRSNPRRWRPWLFVALGLLALIAVAAIAMAVLFPPARVRPLVQAQLAAVLAREVRYEDARIGLWPPVRLTVVGPALAEPGGFARGRALTAKSLHFDLDPWALLSRRVVVRRLVLDRPEVHLLLRPDGSTNLDGVVREQPPARRAGRPMDFEVRALAIDGGRLLIDDLKARRRIALALDTRVALSSRGGGTRYDTSGETTIADLAFGSLSARRLEDLNRTLAGLTWKIGHQGAYDAEKKRLALERLAVGFGRTELALQGIVDDLGPRARVDLRAQGSGVDFGEILRFLAAAEVRGLEDVRAAGRLDFDLAMRGALGGARPPAVVGTARVADASARWPGAPAGVENLAFSARFAPDSLGIGDLAARVAGQPVTGRLAVTSFADPRVAFHVRGDLDLAAVGPLVAPKDTKLGGRAKVDVGGTGRAADPGGFALEGGARLADVSVEHPGLPSKIEGIRGEVRFSPARATVSGLAARAGKSSFELDAMVTRPLAIMATPGKTAPAAVDFELRSPYLDLAELIPAGPGGPMAANAVGDGRVRIGRLRNQKLDVRNVVARVSLEPGVVAVPEYTFDGYGGRAAGRARFDLRNPAEPRYAVKAQFDSVDADALISAWTPASGLVHGALNTTIDLSGAGMKPAEVARTLTASGLAAIANGTLGPGPVLEAIAGLTKIPDLRTLKIRDGAYPFAVEQGRVMFREARFSGPTGDWRVVGSVGFDGSLDQAVSITLPRELTARLGKTAAAAAGALADDQGRMLLDLKLRGTAKKPVVTFDSQAMKDRLAGRASAAIEQQKKRLEQQLIDAALKRRSDTADSARDPSGQARRAAEDSLRRLAEDLLKGFFGKSGKPDTTKR